MCDRIQNPYILHEEINNFQLELWIMHVHTSNMNYVRFTVANVDLSGHIIGVMRTVAKFKCVRKSYAIHKWIFQLQAEINQNILEYEKAVYKRFLKNNSCMQWKAKSQ